jgi:large subunit ribosomal protein L15
MEIQGLHNLVAPIGARHKKKRLGRGIGSGHGKTSGKGGKGQKARKSGNVRPGFEGGQLPLARRQPKRGQFKNFDFRRDFAVVNLGRIAERFEVGAVIDPEALVAAGLVDQPKARVKVLAVGDLPHALRLKVHAISASARSKVESKGGTVELIDVKPAATPAA